MEIPQLEEHLDAAVIRSIQEQNPGSIVTYWTTIVTIVSADGTEMLLTLDRPGQEMWQSMGLLDMTREMRRALIARQVSGDG